MATKKTEKITVAKPIAKDSFTDIDKIINAQFNDIIDMSKIDTKIKTWYDWGVYALNYICSKNLFGGVPAGRVSGIESLSGCGKSLMCASLMRDPKIDYVIIIETEGGGHSAELLEFAGVDPNKIRIMKANTFASYKITKKTQKIEEIHDKELPQAKSKWETDSYVFIEGATSKIRRFIYSIMFGKIKKNILIILDSLGNMQSVRGLSGTCYVPNTKINVLRNNKEMLFNIKDVKIGDKVLTHLGEFKNVLETYEFDDKKEIIEIETENDGTIKCTPNHPLLVKRNCELQWIKAEDLTTEDELQKWQ
jgi:hypothetical protein